MEGGDTINPITIPSTPLGATSSGAPGAAKAPLESGARGAFASLFAGKLTAASTSSSAGTAVPTVDAELVRSVKEQLDAGTSLSDIVARLASSLATSVAAQLGVTPDEAKQRLTQAFTQALQPSETGPPRTNAERASSLVSRLRRIAELATGVTKGETGQPIRLIAGQRSDAEQAKAKTGPPTDSILRDALAALAAPGSPTPGAADPPAVPAAPAAATDARTVALSDPAQAIATGGDTPLGRILARAVLAGEQRSTAADGTSAPAKLAAGPSAGSSTNGGTTAAHGGDAVDAFVQAFASALARADGNASGANAQAGGMSIDFAATAPAARASHDDPAAPLSPSNPATTPAFAIPLAHDAAPVAPPAPAPPLPQAQHVDANAVVDQLLRGVAIRTTDGQSEVRLRLVPENLGDVSVKLVVSGGSVDASLVAHTAEAQNALAGGAAQLAKTLADAGLKLQSFTVGLAGGFDGARDQSRSHDPGTRSSPRRIGGLRSTETDEPDETALLAAPAFGPPIYSPNRAPWALEYLA